MALIRTSDPDEARRAARGWQREGLSVSVRKPEQGWRISLCGLDGQSLLTQPASGKPVTFDLAKLPKAAAQPACVKLLDGSRLVDAAPVPAR